MNLFKNVISVGVFLVLGFLLTTSQVFAISATSTEQLKLLTPNGGEQWMLNSELTTISWTPDPHSDDVEAYLETKNKKGVFVTVGKVFKAGKGSIQWLGEIDRIDNYAKPGSGYYIRIVNTKTGQTDRSDKPFTILPVDAMSVTLNLGDKDNKLYVANSQNVKLSWTTKGSPTSCTLYTYDKNGNDVSSKAVPVNGSATIFADVPNPDFNGGQYTAASVSCSGPLGSRGDYVDIIAQPTINVISPPAGNIVSTGGSVFVRWDEKNITTDNGIRTITIQNAAGTKAFKRVLPEGTINKGDTQYSLQLPSLPRDPNYIPAGNYTLTVSGGGASGVSGIFTVVAQSIPLQATIDFGPIDGTVYKNYTVEVGKKSPFVNWSQYSGTSSRIYFTVNNEKSCGVKNNQVWSLGKTSNGSYDLGIAPMNRVGCELTFNYEVAKGWDRITDKATLTYVAATPVTTTATTTTMITPTIAKGATGEKVSLVQQALKQAGYFTEEVTGYFGDLTKNAVASFQKANSLDNVGAVGAVGPKTAELLNKLLGL